MLLSHRYYIAYFSAILCTMMETGNCTNAIPCDVVQYIVYRLEGCNTEQAAKWAPISYVMN